MAIVIVGMLDEREEALKIIKDQVRKRGHQAILIDVSIGTGAIVSSLKADVPSEEIAHLGGGTIEQIRGMLAKEREKATSIVGEGLAKKVTELYRANKLEGG
jgi:uncharacterized protein (UPF0261 family)